MSSVEPIKSKWYHKPIIIVLLLVLFFPIGLFLMWNGKIWSKNARIVITSIVVLLFIIGISRQKKDYNITTSDHSNKELIKENVKITETSVIGLYSGPGLYGFGATVKLHYGGAFVMEDPGSPSGGPSFGNWVLNGDEIDFYMGGRNVFSARVINKGIIIGGKRWEKVR